MFLVFLLLVLLALLLVIDALNAWKLYQKNRGLMIIHYILLVFLAIMIPDGLFKTLNSSFIITL